MEHKPGTRAEGEDLSTELRASVAARRELGPEMEDHVLEAFLARVQAQVDAAVRQRIETSRPASRQIPIQRRYRPAEVVGASFGTAIPLVLFAGIFAHTVGVVAVMVAVIAVNLMYVLSERL